MQADDSIVMPIMTKALLSKRARLAALEQELGPEELRRRHPEAEGYLRDPAGYRLFERRGELLDKLRAEVRKKRSELVATTKYDLA